MFACLTCLALIPAVAFGDPPSPKVELSTIVTGDADWDWTQCRTTYVPGDSPLWLTTMSRTKKVGAHGYHDVYLSTSRDRGATWSVPEPIPALRRRRQSDGYEVAAGDLWPRWHAGTGKVLITGKTFNFAGGSKENYLREKVAYAVYDPATGDCGPLRAVELPEHDATGKPMLAANAGCHQSVHQPNGDVLLPIRYQRDAGVRRYTSTVARCRFDGETLSYVEHGSEHTVDRGRGLYEPSVTRVGDRYLLTMRSDKGAFVAVGGDDLRFDAHVPWTFDDGELLGSYHTQQHFVTVGGRPYLVYTRRGADNDHIFRHRAPLFLGEIDPDRPCVVRATERVLVPENHATLGNSGVCRIDANETWVTVAEGRVSLGERKGDVNRVILARITAEGSTE